MNMYTDMVSEIRYTSSSIDQPKKRRWPIEGSLHLILAPRGCGGESGGYWDTGIMGNGMPEFLKDIFSASAPSSKDVPAFQLFESNLHTTP